MINIQLPKLSQTQLNLIMQLLQQENLNAFVSSNAISSAIETLKEEFKKDPYYLWSWQANLAMSYYDATPQDVSDRHMYANIGAADFIQRLFDIDVSEHEEFKRFESIWEENTLFEYNSWPKEYGERLRNELNLNWKESLSKFKYVKKIRIGYIPFWSKQEVPHIILGENQYPNEDTEKYYFNDKDIVGSAFYFMNQLLNGIDSDDAFTYRAANFENTDKKYLYTQVSVIRAKSNIV